MMFAFGFCCGLISVFLVVFVWAVVTAVRRGK